MSANSLPLLVEALLRALPAIIEELQSDEARSALDRVERNADAALAAARAGDARGAILRAVERGLERSGNDPR
ncbi:MAG: hypothetical protein SF028_05215 [Candidatus Sumerlaeia bacterium]|nr:hypothetical protein [Candidatus Sumerlaeia bacterium]